MNGFPLLNLYYEGVIFPGSMFFNSLPYSSSNLSYIGSFAGNLGTIDFVNNVVFKVFR